MKKYLRVEIGSRGEMDCLIVNSSIDILNKKFEKIRREFEDDEFIGLDLSEDKKLVSLGLNEEEREIYISEEYKKYDEVLGLWNEGKEEEFRDLVFDIEDEIY